MKTALLCLFALLLFLSSCAPEREPSPGASGGAAQDDVLSREQEPTDPLLNDKSPLVWDEEEEYFTDSVIVTLKASASDHTAPPTAADFEPIAIKDIEHLVLGGFDPEGDYDWERYFAVEGRKECDFRWRLRLTLACETREELYRTCQAIDALDTVAKTEPQATQFAEKDGKRGALLKTYNDDHPEHIMVVLRHSYSDPAVQPFARDFPEISAVGGAKIQIFSPKGYPDGYFTEDEFNWDLYFAVKEEGAFGWGIHFTLNDPALPEEDLIALCRALSERPDVHLVWPED